MNAYKLSIKFEVQKMPNMAFQLTHKAMRFFVHSLSLDCCTKTRYALRSAELKRVALQS